MKWQICMFGAYIPPPLPDNPHIHTDKLFAFFLVCLIWIGLRYTTAVFLLFPNGFLLCDHGLDS